MMQSLGGTWKDMLASIVGEAPGLPKLLFSYGQHGGWGAWKFGEGGGGEGAWHLAYACI